MRKKILFGHHGLIGDIAMNVPSIDSILKVYPESEVWLCIHKDYKVVAPIFENQDKIAGVFISNEYENFPDSEDYEKIIKNNFDLVFNPMQSHKDDNWWKGDLIQTQEVAYSYGLPICNPKINLKKWFCTTRHKKYIAFQPYAGNYNPSNTKRLSEKKAQEIVDGLILLGYNVLQIGAPEEKKLKGCVKLNTNLFESIKNFLGCDLLIHTDSFSGWYASGYNFPTIGLYNYSYYGEDKIKNIQPVNPNAQYLNYSNMDNVEFDQIKEILKNI